MTLTPVALVLAVGVLAQNPPIDRPLPLPGPVKTREELNRLQVDPIGLWKVEEAPGRELFFEIVRRGRGWEGRVLRAPAGSPARPGEVILKLTDQTDERFKGELRVFGNAKNGHPQARWVKARFTLGRPSAGHNGMWGQAIEGAYEVPRNLEGVPASFKAARGCCEWFTGRN